MPLSGNTPTHRALTVHHNRTARRSRHSPRGVRAARITLGAVVPVAVLIATAGTAQAAEPLAVIADQPGVTGPAQPGTSPPPAPPAPEPAPEPVPPPPPQPAPTVYYAQPPEVRNAPTRPAPSVQQPVEPIRIEDLHLPEPVEPVAPVDVPDDVIRVGQWETPRPEWLDPACADAINDFSAGVEAQVATALDSVGIPAGRSDRVSGATLAGAGIGGAVGAVALGAPAAAAGAVAGGLIGGTVGGIAGAALGTLVPIPVIGEVTSGVAGTALGAAAGAVAGAVVAGVPVAAVGAVTAGTVGAGFGAGVGVGQ
ncbi:insoluble domain protein [Nocardia takedensis]